MILAGEVLVDGTAAAKAGTAIAADAQIEVTSRAQKYVSRGGIKLEGALADFAIDPAGCICLDLGSSNGGFTDCLLQRGASRVYAVDVNVDQLDWKLQQDPRVFVSSAMRANWLARISRKRSVWWSSDVSFISVTQILAPAIPAAKADANFLILIKPQFELTARRHRPGRHCDRMRNCTKKRSIAKCDRARELGLQLLGVQPSQLAGAEGNQEFFLHARKSV